MMSSLPWWTWLLVYVLVNALLAGWYATGYVLDMLRPLDKVPPTARHMVAARVVVLVVILVFGWAIVGFFTVVGLRSELLAARERAEVRRAEIARQHETARRRA